MTEKRDDFDNPWKTVIEEYFEDFMAFFFPAAYVDIDWSHGYKFLDKELQQVVRDAEIGKRHADKLVEVRRKSGEQQWVLAHIEVQGQHEKVFAQRMYSYNYRIFDRYNRTVASFAVLADESSLWRPGKFGYELWGCKLHFEFPIAKLVDYAERWADLEANDNPFATVVMAHLKAQETQHDLTARYGAKFYLARRLYERGYKRESIIKLFHFIDWIMKLPPDLESAFWMELQQLEEVKRMRYITSVERIGMEKGMEKGLQQGLQQGALRPLLRLLLHRFGPVPEDIQAQLQTLTPEQIEAFVDVALTVDSIAEFATRLPVHTGEETEAT